MDVDKVSIVLKREMKLLNDLNKKILELKEESSSKEESMENIDSSLSKLDSQSHLKFWIFFFEKPLLKLWKRILKLMNRNLKEKINLLEEITCALKKGKVELAIKIINNEINSYAWRYLDGYNSTSQVDKKDINSFPPIIRYLFEIREKLQNKQEGVKEII